MSKELRIIILAQEKENELRFAKSATQITK